MKKKKKVKTKMTIVLGVLEIDKICDNDNESSIVGEEDHKN